MLSWLITALKFFGSSLLDKLIKLGRDIYFEYVTKRQIKKDADEAQKEMEHSKKEKTTTEEKIKATDDFLNKRGRP